MMNLEKRISIAFVAVLVLLALVSIIGAIVCAVNHPYYIAITSAVIAFVMYHQDIKKA